MKTASLLAPPLKCQGIKTRFAPEIRRLVEHQSFARWIEPFCGSCAVALNLQPVRALLCDSNSHVIAFYRDIQSRSIDDQIVRDFLRKEGQTLRAKGESYYYAVRERFNSSPNSLDFLFLNRSCFNGVMRFNRRGQFNVPFCRKPERFSAAYITKICNQVSAVASLISRSEWEFRVSGFRATLCEASESDIVYADPPYAGRHVDYYNGWSSEDEQALAAELMRLRARFILSTWQGNEFRSNLAFERQWRSEGHHIYTRRHFYHVGSSEDLRHPIIEALVTNFAA